MTENISSAGENNEGIAESALFVNSICKCNSI